MSPRYLNGMSLNLRGCQSPDGLRLIRHFGKGVIRGWSLSGLQLMLQAAVCDGGTLDTLPLGKDCLGPVEVNVSRSEVVGALVIAMTQKRSLMRFPGKA
jgi:hypothetical protein